MKQLLNQRGTHSASNRLPAPLPQRLLVIAQWGAAMLAIRFAWHDQSQQATGSNSAPSSS
jgi:hypothetical protein